MSRSANTEALQILSRVGPILAQQQILAERVGYESSILSLDLKASSSEQLQALTQQLNQQGFKAELGNVQTRGRGNRFGESTIMKTFEKIDHSWKNTAERIEDYLDGLSLRERIMVILPQSLCWSQPLDGHSGPCIKLRITSKNV